MTRFETRHVQLTLRIEGGRPVAGLAGELDLADAAEVTRMLGVLLAEHGGLTVDLGELRFMDSSGLHLLADLRAQADEREWPLQVTGAAGAVARLLAIAR